MSLPDPAPIAEQDAPAPRLALAGAALVVATLLVVAIAVVVAVGRLGDDEPPDPVAAAVLIEDASFPVALTPTSDGGFFYGEKETGVIRRVGADGALDPDPVASFEVAADGQRGLLGLVEIDGDLFASLVRASDGVLVVVGVDDGREVWVGPPSTDLANGGHLIEVDGRILIGIGDLQDPAALDRPDAVNGKLLLLDPAGSPDQVPEVLSAGWNNPFAFARTADGTIWVADNAPGSEPERLGRGDEPAADATDLEGERAPSALVDLGDGRLGLCGYVSGTVDAIDVSGNPPKAGDPLVAPCRTGAARLSDGRIVTATETQILITGPLN